MTREETYKEFINIVCEMLGFNKPIDVLKLCQITSEFIMPYEKLITELEKENEKLKEQIEQMKCCLNCKHWNVQHWLCVFSMGDKRHYCKLRRWELAE